MKGPCIALADDPVAASVDGMSDVEAAGDLAASPELRLWLRLSACAALMDSRIDARLRSEFATTRSRLDALSVLDKEPGGLTMGELSKRMMVTNGAVTGLVGRLERQGLVERATLPADRRTHIVRITTAGRDAFRRMAEAKAGWLSEWTAGLPREDVVQLLSLLGRLKQSLRGGGRTR